MTKVAIYCRVEHGESKYSPVALDCQRKRLERYAERHGLIITGYYSDCGHPGTTLERPGLQELLESWRAGKFDTVIVTKRTCFLRGRAWDTSQGLPNVIAITEKMNAHGLEN